VSESTGGASRRSEDEIGRRRVGERGTDATGRGPFGVGGEHGGGTATASADCGDGEVFEGGCGLETGALTGGEFR